MSPGWSFVHLDERSHRLVPDPSAFAGWRVDGQDLDRWLARRGAAPTAGRLPVLTFGSNRCPSKLTWLRERLGLTGPVVMLRADVRGLAAVWAAGFRRRDGARPATLAVDPDAAEVHAVWMATPEQVGVLDVCEGRGERYDLVRLHAGRVVTDDGALVDDPWTYWPAGSARAPLLVGGVPVRCADVAQDDARALDGVAAALPAGVATPQVGAPAPEAWPARVFAYGTLQPGASAWSLMARHTDGAASGWMHGRVLDTGRGYPALVLAADRDGVAHGTVLHLRRPGAGFDALDGYEGPEYVRVRGVAYGADPTGAGSAVWVWAWRDPATVHPEWAALASRWDR